MTVAEMIKKTRTENNMTQEEYASKFYVSRQTVSSWENGKSIPELQTLIDICNTYKMSLDVLLNDDTTYVKKISHLQKMIKKIKYIIPVIVILFCAYLTYCGVWQARNKSMTDEYLNNVSSLGYIEEGNAYELRKGNVTYHVGNQELPKWKWDFSYKNINAYYKNDKMIWDINYTAEDGVGYFTIQVNVDSYISGTVSEEGKIEYQEVTGLADDVLAQNQPEIEKIIEELDYQWQVIYMGTVLLP